MAVCQEPLDLTSTNLLFDVECRARSVLAHFDANAPVTFNIDMSSNRGDLLLSNNGECGGWDSYQQYVGRRRRRANLAVQSSVADD